MGVRSVLGIGPDGLAIIGIVRRDRGDDIPITRP